MKVRRLVLCMFLSLALVVTFIPMIAFGGENDYGSIMVKGWQIDEENNVIWHDTNGAWVEFSEADFAGFDDGYTHAKVGDAVYMDVHAPSGMCVSELSINGVQQPLQDSDCYIFEVETDNVIEIVFEDIDIDPDDDDGNTFEPWSADWEANADIITLDEPETVNTNDKDGLFIFTAPEDGIYVFYSYDIDGREADPKGRVLDENGEYVASSDDDIDLHFNIYFEAEEGETFYLQAINYDGTATFMVNLVASDIESITFTPKKTYQLREEVDGWYERDGDDSRIWYWDSPQMVDGDKLTLIMKNGEEVTYECKSFVDEDGDSYLEFVNINDADDFLPGFPEFDLEDKWASLTDYSAGDQTVVEICYATLSAEVTVEFVGNPFEALSISPSTGIKVKKYCDDRYCGEWEDVSFTFTKSDGSKVKYVSEEGGILFNKETGDYLYPEWEPWGNYEDESTGEIMPWEPGKSYTTTYCVAGLETEIGVTIDNTISHYYEEVEGTATAPTCTTPGKKADQKCTECGEVIQGEVLPVAHETTHKSTPAGYLKDGASYDYCSICGQKLNYAVIPGWSTSFVKGLKVAKGKGKITVKWKKQNKKNLKKFNGYQIRYSTSPDMSGAKYTTAGKKSKSKKIGKLAKKTKYYVQVRTYTTTSAGTFYSGWSTKSVKTK